MIYQLTEHIYFGNWMAPFECPNVGAVINVAHFFNPARGRDKYWSMLATLPYDVLYFRMAKKDAQKFDEQYAGALSMAVACWQEMRPTRPLVTHCQMGGHRGPSSAIYVAWTLSGRRRESLEDYHSKALKLVPGLVRARPNGYYFTMMDYCREQSV